MFWNERKMMLAHVTNFTQMCNLWYCGELSFVSSFVFSSCWVFSFYDTQNNSVSGRTSCKCECVVPYNSDGNIDVSNRIFCLSMQIFWLSLPDDRECNRSNVHDSTFDNLEFLFDWNRIDAHKWYQFLLCLNMIPSRFWRQVLSRRRTLQNVSDVSIEKSPRKYKWCSSCASKKSLLLFDIKMAAIAHLSLAVEMHKQNISSE